MGSALDGLGMSVEQLRAGLDRSPAAFATYDLSGSVVYANDAFCALTGRTTADLSERTWADLTHPDDVDRDLVDFRDLVSGRRETAVREKRYVRPDGTSVSARVKVVRLPGSPIRLFVAADDTTVQKQQAATLAYRATHDDLTGLPARALFLELVGMAVLRLHRAPALCVAVGFLDVDGLKHVNDTYGHGVGDELIAAIPARMRHAIRPADVIARVGGDEFTVLLEGECDAAQEQVVARRLLAALEQPFELSVGPVRVAASLGLVTTQQPAAKPEMLLSHADAAMYSAKRRGGNQFAVFDERADLERIGAQRVESELRDALVQEELELAYQPIIDLRDNRVLGVEALLRWQHPTRGKLTAGDFIETAERSGLIIPIGRWVIAEACAQLARWDDELGSASPRSLFVNVSARELEAAGLIGDLAAALEDSQVEPARICLEITETEILHDPDAARAVLLAAEELGFGLAIDDFGTGYASLSRLTEIHARTVKLDASFVREVRRSREAMAIVSATLLLAHNLRQNVIAEGLENQEDLAVLREMGCEYGQGFHIARPLDAASLSDWVSANAPVQV